MIPWNWVTKNYHYEVYDWQHPTQTPHRVTSLTVHILLLAGDHCVGDCTCPDGFRLEPKSDIYTVKLKTLVILCPYKIYKHIITALGFVWGFEQTVNCYRENN